MNPDPRIPSGVVLRESEGFVGAAVVDDGVVPVLVRLGEDAFDAFAEMVFPVVNRSNDADERLAIKCHLACDSGRCRRSAVSPVGATPRANREKSPVDRTSDPCSEYRCR